MKSRTTRGGFGRSSGVCWCAAAILASAASGQAQQRYYPQPQGGYAPPPQYSQPAAPPGYGYPQQSQPQYENPIQFLPKFGQRMSEMMRRLFYGKESSGYDYGPQGYPQDQGPGGGYSLDGSPHPQSQQYAPTYPQQYPTPGQGYSPQQSGQAYVQPPSSYQQPGYQYPQQPQEQSQPRYNYPPQQPSQPQSQQTAPPRTQPQHSTPSTTKSTPPAPSTQSKSSTSSGKRTYTPPKVTQSPPPAPKTTSKPPPTVTPKKESKPDAPPPPPTTTRRSESTPKEFPTTASSGASGSFLKGKKTAKPGRVISPYAPYKELDITGLESGSLALDPTTQKVFEVP